MAEKYRDDVVNVDSNVGVKKGQMPSWMTRV